MECELKLAIESGDVARAKKLLRENPSLINNSLLCTSARTGSHTIVRELISRFELKLNLIDTNADGWTALQLASRGGHHKVVRLLLATCLPARQRNARDKRVQWCKRPSANNEGRSCSSELSQSAVGDIHNGETALHLAAKGGHHTVAELLLPHCSESTLNAVDLEGSTALALAASRGRLKVVQLLVAENPNPAGSLENAVQNGHDEIVKLLLARYPEEIVGSDHEMSLAMRSAVISCRAKYVKLLLEARPELLRDEFFFEAISHIDTWDIFLVLLNECERVRGPLYVCELLAKTDSSTGLTILHRAFRAPKNARDALIPRLMEFEWQQQQTSIDSNGNTLLHDAAEHLNSQVLERVLAMDPTLVRRTNDYNQTPFDLAACWRPGWPNAELMLRFVSLENIMEYRDFALGRVPALLEEFVRPPLLLLGLHRDVVGIVCDYSSFMPDLLNQIYYPLLWNGAAGQKKTKTDTERE